MGTEFELKYAATAAQLDLLKQRYPGLRLIRMETTYSRQRRRGFFPAEVDLPPPDGK